MDFENGLKFVIARAEALAPDPSNPGAMIAIAREESKISECIHELGIQDQAVIAVYNRRDSHVVSGVASAIEKLYTTLKGDGVRCTILRVDQGVCISFRRICVFGQCKCD